MAAILHWTDVCRRVLMMKTRSMPNLHVWYNSCNVLQCRPAEKTILWLPRFRLRLFLLPTVSVWNFVAQRTTIIRQCNVSRRKQSSWENLQMTRIIARFLSDSWDSGSHDAMHKHGLCRRAVSVCPSVRSSQSCRPIVSKRLIMASNLFHDRTATPF